MTVTQPDIDFNRIVPRCGGQREAFEDLCCQLAHRTVPSGVSFTRLRGAGGDGGIECYADLSGGQRVGWQAKYVFRVDPLLAQTARSLITALEIHPALTQFVLCFPFDPTGTTGRGGRSDVEKLEAWCQKQVQDAADRGRVLKIEVWPASRLESLLLTFDTSGGIRTYFFDETVLSPEWFKAHLETARAGVGPRYAAELNVRTNVGKWFSALGRTADWQREIDGRLRDVGKKHRHFLRAIERTKEDRLRPNWPDSVREEAARTSEKTKQALDACNALKELDSEGAYHDSMVRLEDVLFDLSSLEAKLAADLEGKHGPGVANSPGFRQLMAEYEVSFPAANLDAVRDVSGAIHDLHDWLATPEGFLAFRSAFVLSGGWGVGKTHAVLDVALQRLEQQLFSCVIFGHQFGGEPDPWARLTETLGLPVTIGRDRLLDALAAAAEASGQPLVLFVDAINETRPLQYWHDRLVPFAEEVARRSGLRICFTCRTPYLHYCLPETHGLPVVDHPGFKGMEQIACKAFFGHYGLKPPVAPLLQPEFANPLYLRLVCDTLRARGIDTLPSGWSSTDQVIAAFLAEKETEFGRDNGVSPGARVVTASLRGIARAIAESGRTGLSWSEAVRVVCASHPEASMLRVVEWLVGANLLIEEASDPIGGFPLESMVRPAFERFGDFLIASELLSQSGDLPLKSALDPGGRLYPLVQDAETRGANYGVLSALSILISESEPGTELPELVSSDDVHARLSAITVEAIPWRDPSSFSSATRDLLLEALADQEVWQTAIDSILSVAWQPSAIDATWLHGLLCRIPLARRDGFWCVYLYHSYERSGPVRRLIDAAFGLPLDAVDSDVAERWAMVLSWFTASPDRRVKGWAARALIQILIARPAVILQLLAPFIHTDDDEVREEYLLASYGALLISRDADVTRRLTNALQAAFRDSPQAFENAMIRDLIRCVSELAAELDVLPEDCDPQLTRQPITTEWPTALAQEDQIEAWENLIGFKPDEFVSDFYKYSMRCLRPWEHAFPKQSMGEWIVQRVARDLGYVGSAGCQHYDHDMLARYGGGRSKPVWAERIGKKYQWIAMYQLASRLHDHVDRRRDIWEPAPRGAPLILLSERKLDPTLPPEKSREGRAGCWWVDSEVDLDPTQQLSDEEWVSREEDLPTLEQLLSAIEHTGQDWRLLVSYLSWGQQSREAGLMDPYRQAWMHIHSYLVREADLSAVSGCLHRRNFFGRWMPEGAPWQYGFAGEYPWATPFNVEGDDLGGARAVHLPAACRPCWNELVVEWEYDVTHPTNYHMLVPAPAFFLPPDLWWNGQDGFRLAGGRTVFRNPSITESGPDSLLVDVDDLAERLSLLGMRLVWTLLGEKWILGGPDPSQTPRRTFSQIAWMNADGTVHVGDRVFFAEYNDDTGPSPIADASTDRPDLAGG